MNNPIFAATNRFKLSCMSDEEFADWLYKMQVDAFVQGFYDCESSYPGTTEEWLEWLKQEVEK